jgi:hypothetical protein
MIVDTRKPPDAAAGAVVAMHNPCHHPPIMVDMRRGSR